MQTDSLENQEKIQSQYLFYLKPELIHALMNVIHLESMVESDMKLFDLAIHHNF